MKTLQDSVDRINQTVVNLQGEFHCLKEDVQKVVKETNILWGKHKISERSGS